MNINISLTGTSEIQLSNNYQIVPGCYTILNLDKDKWVSITTYCPIVTVSGGSSIGSISIKINDTIQSSSFWYTSDIPGFLSIGNGSIINTIILLKKGVNIISLQARQWNSLPNVNTVVNHNTNDIVGSNNELSLKSSLTIKE
mgnify:CR=1 FL=1